MRRLLPLVVVMLTACVSAPPAPPVSIAPAVLFLEPSETPGDPIAGRSLLDLCQHVDQWPTVAARTSYIGAADWAVNLLTDDEQRDCFAQMKTAGLALELGVSVLKDWCSSADACFDSTRYRWDRILKNGGVIGMVSLDEPLTAVVTKIDAIANGDRQYALDQTRRWIMLFRASYPSILINSEEAYPVLSAADLSAWARALASAIDIFTVDHDTVAGGTLADLGRLRDVVHAIPLRFGLLIWPDLDANATDAATVAAMDTRAQRYAAAGLYADVYGYVSWNHAPRRTVPETDPTTLTGGALVALPLLRATRAAVP